MKAGSTTIDANGICGQAPGGLDGGHRLLCLLNGLKDLRADKVVVGLFDSGIRGGMGVGKAEHHGCRRCLEDGGNLTQLIAKAGGEAKAVHSNEAANLLGALPDQRLGQQTMQHTTGQIVRADIIANQLQWLVRRNIGLGEAHGYVEHR